MNITHSSPSLHSWKYERASNFQAFLSVLPTLLLYSQVPSKLPLRALIDSVLIESCEYNMFYSPYTTNHPRKGLNFTHTNCTLRQAKTFDRFNNGTSAEYCISSATTIESIPTDVFPFYSCNLDIKRMTYD